MSEPMSMSEARRLYTAGGGEWECHRDEEHEAIRGELERVVAARTLGAAAEVIRWWDGIEAAVTFARKVLAAAGRPEPSSDVERLTVERDAALAEVERLRELVEFLGSEDE